MLGNDLNRETDTEVYFFTPPFYALDNFSAYTVEIWGRRFPTAEHAFQWKKFSECCPEIAEAIFFANSPSEVKTISDQHKDKMDPQWHEIKVAIMEDILLEKTRQHEKVRRVLKNTGDRTVIENSPTDNFWGIGPDGNGQNMLGKIWMKIRDTRLTEILSSSL